MEIEGEKSTRSLKSASSLNKTVVTNDRAKISELRKDLGDTALAWKAFEDSGHLVPPVAW